MGGVYPSAPGANDPSPQGTGTGMGRVQVRPAADPPRGLMLQCCQGFTAPIAPGRPPDHSRTSLRLGRERWGGGSATPPSHFSPTFARFPTSIGSVRKLIVYKYPSSARPGTQVEAAGGHQGPPQGRVPDLGPTQGSPLKQLRFSKEKGKMEKETEERKKKCGRTQFPWLAPGSTGGWVEAGSPRWGREGSPPLCKVHNEASTFLT